MQFNSNPSNTTVTARHRKVVPPLKITHVEVQQSVHLVLDDRDGLEQLLCVHRPHHPVNAARTGGRGWEGGQRAGQGRTGTGHTHQRGDAWPGEVREVREREREEIENSSIRCITAIVTMVMALHRNCVYILRILLNGRDRYVDDRI